MIDRAARLALLATLLGFGGPGPARRGYVTAPDGARLWYQVRGAGSDTILAVHGGPGETLATLVPALEPLTRRHTIIGYDQRGNGRSSAVDDSTHISIEYHLADLEAIRARFRLDRPTLLGHSWGGDLVALYAARHPDQVGRLILVDPGAPRSEPFDRDAGRGRMAGLDSTARDRLGRLGAAAIADTAHDPGALCRDLYHILLRNYYVDRTAMRRAVDVGCSYPGYNLRRANRVSRLTEESGFGNRVWDTLVTRVRAPTLVVRGSRDFIPLASSEIWARAFPNGRLLVIEGAAHFPFSDNPAAFFPAIDSFLRGEWPAGSRRD